MMNLERLVSAYKIKLLFDKWIIIQNSNKPEIAVRRRRIQDETINVAHEIKEFELI
jgi:hypothetical protein